jgi:hypothetical protein
MDLISALSWERDGELTPSDMATTISRLLLTANSKEKKMLTLFAKKKMIKQMPAAPSVQ